MSDKLRSILQNSATDVADNSNIGINFNFNNISGDSKVRKIPIANIVPAPEEWNFYRPLSNDKMTELIESILSKGLLNPIVVWEQAGGTYMNLAGHNRVKAYEYILNATGNDEYKYIDAHIKGKDEIDEIEAREIIIDTNWVQRELTPIEKSRSIVEKYTILQSKASYKSNKGKYGEGRIRDIIAKQYNLKGRQIDNYRRLVNLIPELQTMLTCGLITPTPASELAVLDKDIQLWIYENFKDKLKSKYTRRINASMDKDTISRIFQESKEVKDKENDVGNYIKIKLNNKLYAKYEKCSVEIKEKLEEDFQIFFEEWIKNKIKI